MPRLRQRLCIGLEFLRVSALFMRRGVDPCSTSLCSPDSSFCAFLSPMSASPTDFDRYRSRPGNRRVSYAIPISAARVRRRIHMRVGSSLRRHEIGPSLFSAPGRACRTRHAPSPACASCQGLSRVRRGDRRDRRDLGDSPGGGARRHPGPSGVRHRLRVNRKHRRGISQLIVAAGGAMIMFVSEARYQDPSRLKGSTQCSTSF